MSFFSELGAWDDPVILNIGVLSGHWTLSQCYTTSSAQPKLRMQSSVSGQSRDLFSARGRIVHSEPRLATRIVRTLSQIKSDV